MYLFLSYKLVGTKFYALSAQTYFKHSKDYAFPKITLVGRLPL